MNCQNAILKKKDTQEWGMFSGPSKSKQGQQALSNRQLFMRANKILLEQCPNVK
jgi:hypothetical protein